jgi:hypothetical protein
MIVHFALLVRSVVNAKHADFGILVKDRVLRPSAVTASGIFVCGSALSPATTDSAPAKSADFKAIEGFIVPPQSMPGDGEQTPGDCSGQGFRLMRLI